MMTVKTDAPPEASARSACPSARDKTKLFQISISLFFFFYIFPDALSRSLLRKETSGFFLLLLLDAVVLLLLRNDA